MTIGLSNGSKRSQYGSTVNQNQGGGNKKSGSPYQVGRGWRTNIAFGSLNGVITGRCNNRKAANVIQLCFTETVHQSRPVGSTVNSNAGYWRVAP